MHWIELAVLSIVVQSNRAGDVVNTTVYLEQQKRLFEALVGESSSYNTNIRPAKNESETVMVGFDFSLRYIQDLSEEEQILYTQSWMRMSWEDIQLRWDPNEYGGINTVHIPASMLWTPDITLYNSHDMYVFGTNEDGRYNALVYPDGGVHWYTPVWLASHCPIDVQKFPYDTQVCKLKFGSWVYSSGQLDLTWQSDYIDLSSGQFDHHEFDLIKHEKKRNAIKYPCCLAEYVDLEYYMTFRRHSSYAVHLMVAPSVVLCLIVPVVFLLPPDVPEKVTFGVGLMMTESVLLLALIDMVPTKHPTLPNIGIYHVTNIVLIAVSLAISVLVLNIWNKSGRASVMPRFLKNGLLPLVGKIVFVGQESFLATGDSYNRMEMTTEEGNSNTEDDMSQIIKSREIPGGEWRHLAAIIDRVCFVIFIIAVFSTTLAFCT